jgi:hypothetical protein
MPGGVAEHIDAFRVDDDIHEFGCWMTKEEAMKLERISMYWRRGDDEPLGEPILKAMGMSDAWFVPVDVFYTDTADIKRYKITVERRRSNESS